jgi:hypothetical protein
VTPGDIGRTFAAAQSLRGAVRVSTALGLGPGLGGDAGTPRAFLGVMEDRKRVHYYGYVGYPYNQVRALLQRAPLDLLQRATTSAAARAGSIAASLRVGVGGVEVAVDVRVHIRRIRDDESIAGLPPSLSVDIAWEASHGAPIFPLMEAQLSAWQVSAEETQLDIEGYYRPPFGPIGSALDRAVGHRIAQAAVHRFFEDTLEEIRRELSAPEKPRS